MMVMRAGQDIPNDAMKVLVNVDDMPSAQVAAGSA